MILDGGAVIEIGTTEAKPTIGITDYSRRETDDFGVTTVVKRGFSRTMSVRVKVPTGEVDGLQRQLAALRAKAVQWVADDRFDSLSITGFYKDLSIDLAIPPVSYCTLTIEGLAETGAFDDPGDDPATDQRASTLKLVRPAVVDDDVLVTSTVPENDYPVWSAGLTYALGNRVIDHAAHRIYESAIDGNIGHDPADLAGQWIDIGPTNRWAMFDQALGSLTEAAGSIVVTLNPVDPIDAIALLDVTATSVRVQGVGYDQSLAPAVAAGAVSFLDMPETASTLTITISGPGTVSVGTLLIGKLVGLGTTEASPTAAITDYSRKETDDFGEVTVVERAWAKRMEVRALISTASVDLVAARIANVRATPALWIGDAALESLAIYGFFKDFSIEVDEHVSTLALSIEGLSAAAKLAPLIPDPEIGWDDVKDDNPEHPKPEDGATVGAPDWAPVGGTTAGTIVAALLALGSVTDPDEIVAGALALIDRTQNHALALFDAQLLGEERKARWDRLTHLDGAEITTRVRQEITERIEGDTAIVEMVTEIEAAATDGLNAALAAISDEASVRAAADTAETTQRELAISLVQTRIDDEVIDLQAAILNEATTRADAIAAETTQREIATSALQSALDGHVTTLQASIEAEATTRASADAAETSQRELAISTLQGVVDGQIADVTAAISSEASTRATAIAAETLAREQAISEIETTIDGEISTVMAAIASEASTRATADEAEASQREALAASIASDLADVNAAILNEASVRATGDEAEATAREALAATLSGDIADVSAAVETEATARAAEDGALASLISGVQTTVDGHTASVALLLESVDGLNSRLVARVVSGDMIGGFELAAGGGEIDANFLVDNFRVLSPSGGDGWQFSDGRQVTTGGTIMTITGAPFGSSEQFLEWTGPIVSTYEECTEANAIKYMKIDGSAYFGGGLSSGILKNEATSNVVSSTAFVTVGPFTSNGNTVNININARYYREYRADSGTGGITGSGSGVITVEHSADSTNWTSIGTMGVAESLREVIVDGEPGVPDVIQWEMSGAGTLIWNPGPLSGLFIRARWTSRLFPAFNGTPLFGTEERQSVTIIAVETP
ncbi:MAG: hypothetical protein DI569_12495 [Sphingopyxis macrogoltabida]|uniref:DUF1983 domain-containing protein n=1 Tax=Sphingopyxis macrogoltabida TaxID=33050 RepID=A0A2W5KW26_SPHMC|nr:MAG: hypothetical protein DI569_12495 [Sphingopyxis macrogoltabida]